MALGAVLALVTNASAADPQYVQYIESPYHWVREPRWINPRTTGLASDIVGFLGTLGRLPFEKYERTSLLFDVRAAHPLQLQLSEPLYETEEDVIDVVQRGREIYAGNVWTRFSDYHVLDFGALYWLTGNFYDQRLYLSYVQETIYDDLEHPQRGTVDLDIDGRSYTELAHQFRGTSDPTQAGLRLWLKTQYRDGDNYQLLLEDETPPFRAQLMSEIFYYREWLRPGQKPRDLLSPEPYPFDSPPELVVHARLQQTVAEYRYDAKSVGLQFVTTVKWAPPVMELHPRPTLHTFPQWEEELRCGIVGSEMDGICALETTPGYRIYASQLRNPLAFLGFHRYFEGIEGDLWLRLKTKAKVDTGNGTFEFTFQPEAQLALRFY